MGGGGGCEYSWSGSLHFSASTSNFSGRKGNFSVIICVFIGVLFLMKLYSSLCMVLDGLMMLWFVCRNWVYGCIVVICLSGGFGSKVIFSKISVVQSGSGVCISR